MIASASSMPAMVELNKYDARPNFGCSFEPSCRQSMFFDPSFSIRPLSANISSTAGEIADERADLFRPRRLYLRGDRGERLGPTSRLQLAVNLHVRPIDALHLEPIDDMTRLIGDPLFVDRFVDARQDTDHFAATRVDADRRADAVHHVNRFGFDIFPRARMELRRALRSARRRGRDRRHCPAIRRSALFQDRA